MHRVTATAPTHNRKVNKKIAYQSSPAGYYRFGIAASTLYTYKYFMSGAQRTGTVMQ